MCEVPFQENLKKTQNIVNKLQGEACKWLATASSAVILIRTEKQSVAHSLHKQFWMFSQNIQHCLFTELSITTFLGNNKFTLQFPKNFHKEKKAKEGKKAKKEQKEAEFLL